MADGYEIFDGGHNKRVSRHQLLNAKQIDQVMVALRSLHLTGSEEARRVLLKGIGSPHLPGHGTIRRRTAPGSVLRCERKAAPPPVKGLTSSGQTCWWWLVKLHRLYTPTRSVSSFRLRPATAKPVRGELLTARVFLRGRFSLELCEQTRHARPAPARPS